MTLDQLTILVEFGESETLELKTTTGGRREAARTICAMLNQRGGYVMFGVEPDGIVVGQQVADRTRWRISLRRSTGFDRRRTQRDASERGGRDGDCCRIAAPRDRGGRLRSRPIPAFRADPPGGEGELDGAGTGEHPRVVAICRERLDATRSPCRDGGKRERKADTANPGRAPRRRTGPGDWHGMVRSLGTDRPRRSGLRGVPKMTPPGALR